jgi:hypothetical protein
MNTAYELQIFDRLTIYRPSASAHSKADVEKTSPAVGDDMTRRSMVELRFAPLGSRG